MSSSAVPHTCTFHDRKNYTECASSVTIAGMNTPDFFAAEFERLFGKLGYAFFEDGDFNPNYIGVRSSRTRAGQFDDVFFCLYRTNGYWRVHMWPLTTDPGDVLLKASKNPKGVAILASPQQCRGAYKLGLHKGRPALVQWGKPVRVWRDGNKDDVLDWGDDAGIPGWYGINIHNTVGPQIALMNDTKSLGCQVFPNDFDHRSLLAVQRVAANKYGDVCTYTIIESKQLEIS